MTISGDIADQTGSVGSGGAAGVGALIISGEGDVTLSGDNTFTGGVTIENGATLTAGSAMRWGAAGQCLGRRDAGRRCGDSHDRRTRRRGKRRRRPRDRRRPDRRRERLDDVFRRAGQWREGRSRTGHVGSGSLTLSGANTFSGGVAVEAGTLIAASAQALGAGAATLNGGTLELSAAAIKGGALARPIDIGAAGGAIDLAGVAYVGGETLAYDAATGVATLQEGSTILARLKLAGLPTHDLLQIGSDGDGGTDIQFGSGSSALEAAIVAANGLTRRRYDRNPGQADGIRQHRSDKPPIGRRPDPRGRQWGNAATAPASIAGCSSMPATSRSRTSRSKTRPRSAARVQEAAAAAAARDWAAGCSSAQARM